MIVTTVLTKRVDCLGSRTDVRVGCRLGDYQRTVEEASVAVAAEQYIAAIVRLSRDDEIPVTETVICRDTDTQEILSVELEAGWPPTPLEDVAAECGIDLAELEEDDQ